MLGRIEFIVFLLIVHQQLNDLHQERLKINKKTLAFDSGKATLRTLNA